ncbi:MAG: gas vesicle protein GvpG [Bryobacteraceae bacterium]|jgi:hypothetical protein
MLLVDDVLCFPFTSILWLFKEIGKVAQEEMDGEAQSVTEQLRLLYMQLETGAITEAEFDAEEKLLLDRLDAIDSRLKGEEEDVEPDIASAGDETRNP